MIENKDNLLLLIRKHFPCVEHLDFFTLNIKSRDEYETITKQRFEIRSKVYDYLKSRFHTALEEILDLRNIPQKIFVNNQEWYISISHTEKIGVWILSSKPVGIDLEKRSRVNLDVIKRVCSERELSNTDDLNSLWSIKESALKSIPYLIQPKVISQIIVNKATISSTQDSIFKIIEANCSCFESEKCEIKTVAFLKEDSQLAISVL